MALSASSDLHACSLAHPLRLCGDGLNRGLAQSISEPKMASAVVAAVMGRLDSSGDAVLRAKGFLSAQWVFMRDHAPEHLDHVRGIAEGYGITVENLFAYLHMGLIEVDDLVPGAEEDGCSVVSCEATDAGQVLVKNRDYRGEHQALQRVFLEQNPAWGERQILTVGSLGSPGAYSSGMNSDGLALADTHIGWRSPKIGWLRYLLMNEVLIRTSSVDEALSFIQSQPHAGGGALVLADSTGHAATVELGTSNIHVRTASPTGIGQTNHFLDADLWADQTRSADDPTASDSRGRLARIEYWIDDKKRGKPALNDIASLMACHAKDEFPDLCCHGDADASQTISTALFACASRMLYFCPGNPCSKAWRRYVF